MGGGDDARGLAAPVDDNRLAFYIFNDVISQIQVVHIPFGFLYLLQQEIGEKPMPFLVERMRRFVVGSRAEDNRISRWHVGLRFQRDTSRGGQHAPVSIGSAETCIQEYGYGTGFYFSKLLVKPVDGITDGRVGIVGIRRDDIGFFRILVGSAMACIVKDDIDFSLVSIGYVYEVFHGQQ